MTDREKIVEILKKRVQNLIVSDLISPFFWEDFAVEIESCYNAELEKRDEIINRRNKMINELRQKISKLKGDIEWDSLTDFNRPLDKPIVL